MEEVLKVSNIFAFIDVYSENICLTKKEGSIVQFAVLKSFIL